MRLKNKQTGEIAEIPDDLSALWDIVQKSLPNSSVWEDYEEPKEVWTITTFGEVQGSSPEEDIVPIDPQLIDGLKSIGNYFETKEEAEKAVKKLKAWKRLKDKGFSIDGYTNDIGDNYYMPSDFVIKLNYNGDHRKSYPDDVFKDLDLLFGGEDE